MFARHLIDGSRSLVIGRSHQCDIVIDDESISRRHAILTLGDTITVEDLGSANGTRVRGVRLGAESPSAITVGESVVVGSITLILQPRTLRIVRWSPSAFDARVDQACTSKAACAVLHLAVDRTDIEDALDGVLREADIASASGGTYRVLLLDTSPEGAEVAGSAGDCGEVPEKSRLN